MLYLVLQTIILKLSYSDSPADDILSQCTGVVSDCIGDSALSGDLRWAGTYGVNLDFVARTHCSVEYISIEAVQVSIKVLT